MNEEIENVKVAVRIRNPPFKEEYSKKEAVVAIPDSFSEKLDIHTAVSITDPLIRKGTKMFTFDRVFTEDEPQVNVYQIVHPLIEKCLKGYNGCVFAYGQTNSGKTFTMEGDDAQQGVIPRVASQIMQHVKKQRGTSTEFTLTASYLEIYKEQLKDLLNPVEQGICRINKI
jgi:hypothetical protein